MVVKNTFLHNFALKCLHPSLTDSAFDVLRASSYQFLMLELNYILPRMQCSINCIVVLGELSSQHLFANKLCLADQFSESLRISYDELERNTSLERGRRKTLSSLEKSSTFPIFLEEEKVREMYKEFCSSKAGTRDSRELDSSVMRYAMNRLSKSRGWTTHNR